MGPGIVFEKIVVYYGGYAPQFLFGAESPAVRESFPLSSFLLLPVYIPGMYKKYYSATASCVHT